MSNRYTRVSSLNSPEKFRSHLQGLGLSLGFDHELEAGTDSLFAQSLEIGPRSVGNRFCVLPMEGWDGTEDGKPSLLTRRRWENFGRSGAKLVWGGEAVAVRQDGRANPNQLLINGSNQDSLESLRLHLVQTHEREFGTSRDLLVGLQLTHSGRFSRPTDKATLEPRILYHHPILDPKFGIPPDYPCLTDSEIEELTEDFVVAAARAWKIGFHFVDLKHCHGYLGNELLSARTRGGPYGGSFQNRTRFLRNVISGIRAVAPELQIGVRLNAFDMAPFEKDASGRGVPVEDNDFALFGQLRTQTGGPASISPRLGDPDVQETVRLIRLLRSLGVQLICLSGGSPYYNPHIQRPALFPPSDGYEPPEDPLVGVDRHIRFTRFIKETFPDLFVIGSGYSYLQEWLPPVAHRQLREKAVDFVGLGRMMLAYPQLPAHVLAGQPLNRKSLCRTFSDCTTGPRQGLVSGCFPLDPFYRDHPQGEELRKIKRERRGF